MAPPVNPTENQTWHEVVVVTPHAGVYFVWLLSDHQGSASEHIVLPCTSLSRLVQVLINDEPKKKTRNLTTIKINISPGIDFSTLTLLQGQTILVICESIPLAVAGIGSSSL